MIDQTTGRSDHDLRACLQAAELVVVTLASKNRQLADALFEGGQLCNFFGHLRRQFARRAEHQHLHGAIGRIDQLDGRDAERSGLARPRLRLPDHIVSGEQRRNGFGLNG